MKFKVIGVVVILASLSVSSKGLPLFGDFGLTSSIAEYGEPSAELKRDKRTLTTICVEIKPSSPYEEPYFMCKGTDSPSYAKGSSDSYAPSKQSYNKPVKSSSYPSGEGDSYHSGGVKSKGYSNTPSKPDYHPEHSKYDKPNYDSVKEYSKPSYDKHSSYDANEYHHGDSYSHYQSSQPSKTSSYVPAKPSSYADHHDTQDDYSKPHKVIYEKPSAPPKPHVYSHEDHAPTYEHKQPSGGYSKPSSYDSHASSAGYSNTGSYSGPSEYSKPSSHEHADSHHSYSDEGHSKPSYGGSETYSAPPESKVIYSKPSAYPAKQVSYDHADHSQYSPTKPAYSEPSPPPSSSHYSKPSSSYIAHGQHSSYTQPQGHNYRMMPPELMQPAWEPQPEQLQADGFGYRSFGPPVEYQQRQETPRTMSHESHLLPGMEGPLRFDLSGADQEAPTLQSPYQQQAYSTPAHHVPAAPSYVPQYSPAPPSYSVPTYAPAVPSYAPVAHPVYAPPSSPSYAQVAPSSYAPTPVSHEPPAPPCPQNYLYSYQPVIMSVPCYSLSSSYSLPSYGQSLGAPANINPLQDHSSPRSENNSETAQKNQEDSQESHETEKQLDTEDETSPKKSENLKKSSAEIKEDKPQVDQTPNDQVVGGSVEKPVKETQIVPAGAGAPPKKGSAEAPHTKEAYDAMIKMARIAAQLNKDDSSSKGPSDGSASAGQSSTAAAGTLPQISRSN